MSWKQKAAEEADLLLSDDADSDVDQVLTSVQWSFYPCVFCMFISHPGVVDPPDLDPLGSEIICV